MSSAYKTGDLVWAKMKGFSPWPGRVTLPTVDLKQPPKKNIPVQCIFFFGSNNYAWIEETNIKPYQEFKEQLVKSCKTAPFRDAVNDIEEYIVNPGKFGDIDGLKRDPDMEFNKLKEAMTEIDEVTTPPRKSIDKPKKEKVIKRASATPKISVPRKKVKVDTNYSYDFESENENDDSMLKHSFKKSSLLNRPSNIMRPETPTLDLQNTTDNLKFKNIAPSKMTFGFLGLGIMGGGIVKNLVNSGHIVVVWTRTVSKHARFQALGAKVVQTPCDVVEEADITFSCVSDPQVAKEIVFGNCGVLHATSLATKGYVEMTSIDTDTSQDIADALNSKGARYLEAQMQGSKTEAEEGTLIVLAAGDRTLFDDCQTCFEAISKNSFYLGDIGNASKMNLALQLMNGVVLAGLAECMALADRAGLKQTDVLEVLELTGISCRTLVEKGKAMIENKSHAVHQRLAHLQKDLRLVLAMGDAMEQSLPLAATTNEIFKHARSLGYATHDSSAVYIKARF